jgi:hypothetical protein
MLDDQNTMPTTALKTTAKMFRGVQPEFARGSSMQ